MGRTLFGEPDTKLGIEMELWVVDDAGRLCDGEDLVDAHEHVHPEFIGPLVEIQTTPHRSEAALRRELEATLERLLAAADEAGKHLVPLGTPLTTADPDATDERGRLFERIYGEGVVSAKNCAGTHVHFEKDAVRRQLNLLTALDPAIALVSSSPYYLGERGADSSRAAAYRTDCGDEFERYCDLLSYVDDVDEWEARVDEAFERFRVLAADRGVDPERVDAQFDPEDTMLNPVRHRTAFPTVEWRAPDTALPGQIVRLAFDVRRAVDQTAAKPLEVVDSVAASGIGPDAIRIPEFSTLRSLSDEAIQRGLASDRVRSYLEGMGFEPAAYRPIAGRFDGPAEIGDADAREIRLAYADHLRVDVATLTAGPARSVDARRAGPSARPTN